MIIRPGAASPGTRRPSPNTPSERVPRPLLEQEVFFVAGAIRADEADSVAAVLGVNLFQLGRCRLSGFLPRNGEEFVALAHHGLLDALGVTGEVEAKTAFHAKEVAVDAAQVAVVGAQDFVIANA